MTVAEQDLINAIDNLATTRLSFKQVLIASLAGNPALIVNGYDFGNNADVIIKHADAIIAKMNAAIQSTDTKEGI
jgi:hypothetical protein